MGVIERRVMGSGFEAVTSAGPIMNAMAHHQRDDHDLTIRMRVMTIWYQWVLLLKIRYRKRAINKPRTKPIRSPRIPEKKWIGTMPMVTSRSIKTRLRILLRKIN